jgi:chromosomal replication initiator protein
VALAAGRSLIRALAEQRRPACDRLMLHGPPGVGKTHLAIWLMRNLVRRAPDRTARLIPAAEFTLADERQALRSLDLLILDDLDHLPARAVDDAVVLLDHRGSRRLPTIVTAGGGPGELTQLPTRLTSRLAAGLVVGLDPLGSESRRKLLRRFCQRRDLRVDDEAVNWLVAQSSPGVRPLLGALARLMVLARQQPPPLTLPTVQAFWDTANAQHAPQEPGLLERIVRQVSRTFRLDPDRLTARDRGHQALWPRQVGMYLARELTDLSLAQIGANFGGRDHTTVRHACQKVAARAVAETEVAQLLQRLRAELS